jgi:hypothetical protein
MSKLHKGSTRYKPQPPSEPGSSEAADPPAAPAPFRRDLRTSVLLALVCLLVYNANLRSISAGDTYPARYIPLGIWRYQTVLLDPIASLTAQGRGSSAFWIVKGRDGHAISLYPVVVPVLVAPLYLPAAIYLQARGWDPMLLDRLARIMEKLSASLLAAMSVALFYLLLRRRAERPVALLLTLAFAFGTNTWVISSQALWQHGVGELLIVATMFLLTGPCTTRATVTAGFLCGLIACNRPPDSILAAALGLYGLWWARRRAPALVAAAAALPVSLLLFYNLGVVGNVLGAYGLLGKTAFLGHNVVFGVAALLFSPTRGLFAFSPFLLFLPLCFAQTLRDRGTRVLTVMLGIAVIVQLLLYARADWRQGASFGPRWLTDALPILVWMLAPIVSALRGVRRSVFVWACVASMAIQTVGAFWYTGASDGAIFAAPAGPNQMRAAWDFRNAAFIAELRHPPAPFELATSVRGFLDIVTTSEGKDLDATTGKDLDVATVKEIDIEGWALASGHSPREIIVMLDGQPAATTTKFFDRHDVARALGETSPSGWRVAVAVPDLIPGEHVVAPLVRAYEGGELHFLGERRFTVGGDQQGPAATSPARGDNGDLALSARLAAAVIASHQQIPGYWLTAFTNETRFRRPLVEMNTYVTSVMIDVLDPVAKAANLDESLQRARQHLSGQIEAGGLVRYHGRPDAPTIGTLGCAITPDADDTALVWRIAPSAHRELLPAALATLGRYRTPEGLYRTWLAPRDQYQCIDPGKDPDPADAGIQMHVLMFLAKADPPAAQALCGALGRAIAEDRIWVYYKAAPLVPILRQGELQRTGCALTLPPSRVQTAVPGQKIWAAAGQMLERMLGTGGPAPASAEVMEMLRKLSQDDFAILRQFPPLLYHNDLTASVPRFYWSEDVGYALWLRLYYENARHGPVRPSAGKRVPK